MIENQESPQRHPTPAVSASHGRRHQSKALPHLMPLDKRWAVWRTVCLRSAGFPANMVLKLTAPECAAVADRLIEAEGEALKAQDAALAAIKQALGELKRNRHPLDRAMCNALSKASFQIKTGRVSESVRDFEPARPAIDRFLNARADVELILNELRKSLGAAAERISQSSGEIASTERFHEAIIWQNRRAWHNGIESFLRKVSANHNRGSKQRRNEELIANYLQRYCVKNDTIGFFGPVGWARFTSEGEVIKVRPGPQIIAARSVFFESWCVDGIADVFNKDQSLKPWIAPRVMPFIYVDRMGLHLPGGALVKLTEKEKTILQLCDQGMTAKELAHSLLEAPSPEFDSDREVYAILDSLNAQGMIAWKFEVPLGSRAEQDLRELIKRVEDEGARQSMLRVLDEFEAARDRIAGAAGDPERLDRAVNDLEEDFTRFTGGPSTRLSGKTYAGRTLVYEDCRRDIDVELGAGLLKALEQPLALLLASAHWVTCEVAKAYRQAIQKNYLDLARAGSPAVSAADFWMKADSLLNKQKAIFIDGILSELQKRWVKIFNLSFEDRRVSYTSEQLRPGVSKSFASAKVGWTQARYHSPDILIAASDVEAIAKGDYQLVIGEIHIGINGLNTAVLKSQHPRPEELYEALESDSPESGIAPVPPKHWPELTGRSGVGYVSPNSYRLEISHDSCGVAKSRSLPIGSLVVQDSYRGLLLKSRDGRLQFDVIEAFGQLLSALLMN